MDARLRWAGVHNKRLAKQTISRAEVVAADLVVVLQQLDDDLDVIVVVLDRYDAHDVCSIFSVRIFAVFVGQHQARISFFHLQQSPLLSPLWIRSIFTETNGDKVNTQLSTVNMWRYNIIIITLVLCMYK